MNRQPVRGPATLVVAALAVAALALGCTPSGPGSGPSTPPSRESSGSSRDVGTPGGTPPPSSGVATSERQPPPRPTAPPATTAGPLGAADLPRELPGGFRGVERPPAEAERLPNGSWVFDVPAAQAAWEAVPRCEANDGREWPRARFALGGTHLDARGRPGNALVVEFADAAAAHAYAAHYRAVLASCPRTNGMPAATRLADADRWYAGRRSYASEGWSEVVAERGTRVWLAIWNDGGTSDATAVSALAERLAGG